MLDLILKDIQDPYARENFFRLSRFLNGQILFDGDFEIFDVTIDDTKLNFKVKHGLTFIPTDVILLSIQGDYNFFFEYQRFDRTYIYITASGPCRLRFLAGKLSDKVNRNRGEPFPVVPPGASSLFPGPASQIVKQFNTDVVTSIGDLVIVSGIDTVTKITSNDSLIIPNGIFGVAFNKPTPTTVDVVFAGEVNFYSGFSPGSAIFVSTTGTPTHSVPATGMVQQIGTATNSSTFFVQLMQPMRRS